MTIRTGPWIALALGFAQPASAKTLVFCSEADPDVLDPHTVTSITGVNATTCRSPRSTTTRTWTWGTC